MSLQNENSIKLSAGFVRSKLPSDRRDKSTLPALSIIGFTVTGYLITFWIIVLVPFWPVKIMAIVINGLFIGTLFIVAHDACHQGFTSSKFLNHLIGRIGFLPALTTFSAWEVAHNQLHHGWTNFKRHDVFVPLSKQEFDSLPRWRRGVERFYRTTVGIAFYYQIEVLWKHLIVPRKSDFERMSKRIFTFDISLVAGYAVLQIILLIFAAPILAGRINVSISSFHILLLTTLILPYSVWAWAYAAVTLQHHTHPAVPWFDKESEWSFFNAQVKSSVRIAMPRIAELFLLNIFEHTAHHVDSKIPLYRLRESQKVLEGAFPEEIVVQTTSIKQFHNTMKTCKLYDYDNHQWLDFEGNVTAGIKGAGNV